MTAVQGEYSRRKTRVFHIDDALARFVQSGVAVIVGTTTDDGRPHAAYGWAPRVGDRGRSLSLFLDAPRADTTLADLQSNGRIAVTVGDPVSYRSVQFKGRFQESGEASDADAVWLAAYREAFLVNTSLVGDPPTVIRNLWLDGPAVRITMTVDRAFDQTPGPTAGQPL